MCVRFFWFVCLSVKHDYIRGTKMHQSLQFSPGGSRDETLAAGTDTTHTCAHTAKHSHPQHGGRGRGQRLTEAGC